MKKLMISIYDSKAESWSFPCQADNKATALRMFADLVSDKRTLVGQHPEDFELWQVGTFSLVAGSLDFERNKFGSGNEFVSAEEVPHEIRN